MDFLNKKREGPVKGAREIKRDIRHKITKCCLDSDLNE